MEIELHFQWFYNYFLIITGLCRGLGHQLMTFAVDHCKALGLVSLELYSHTKLGSAIHLYRKFGFVETPLPEGCVYERANIRMVFRG